MLSQLKISQKLWITTLLLAVPALYFVLTDLSNGYHTLTATKREATGLEMANLAGSPLAKSGDFAAMGALAGAEVYPDQFKQNMIGLRAGVRYSLTDAVKPVAARDAELAAAAETAKRFERVSHSWEKITGGDYTITSPDGLSPYAAMWSELLDYQRLAAEQSGLVTDPEVASSSLVNAVLSELPESLAEINEIRSLATMLAGRKSAAGQREATQILTLSRTLRANTEKLRRRLEAAARANPKLASSLTPLAVAFPKITNDYIAWVTERILEPQQITVSAQRTYDEGNRTAQAYYKNYESVSKAAQFALDSRISEVTNGLILRVGIAALGLLIVGFIILSINSGIANQVRSIRETFTQLAEGKLNARAQVRTKDELGELGARLNQMLDQITTLVQTQEEKDQIQRSVQRLLNDVSVVAEGDLTREASVTADLTGAIADAFNYMTAELRQVISGAQRMIAQVNGSTLTVQRVTSSLAENSSSQAEQIAQASVQLDTIARTSQQVSSSAANAAQVATQSLRNAQDGAESVQATIDGMTQIRNQVQTTAKRIKRLGESSQEIGEIVQLISDIADRTSILALNASIQAAMAGEAGKGFALVAEEVERLSERSTEATKKIEGLIHSIQSETAQAIAAMEETTREVVAGSELANNAGETLHRIETVSVQLAQLIRSISEGAVQQSTGSEAVARAMNGISALTRSNASNAQQAARTVQELAGQAKILKSSMDRFRLPAERDQSTLTGQWAAFAGRQ